MVFTPDQRRKRRAEVAVAEGRKFRPKGPQPKAQAKTPAVKALVPVPKAAAPPANARAAEASAPAVEAPATVTQTPAVAAPQEASKDYKGLYEQLQHHYQLAKKHWQSQVGMMETQVKCKANSWSKCRASSSSCISYIVVFMRELSNSPLKNGCKEKKYFKRTRRASFKPKPFSQQVSNSVKAVR